MYLFRFYLPAIFLGITLLVGCQPAPSEDTASKPSEQQEAHAHHHGHSAASGGKAAQQDEETLAMVKRLKEIAENPSPTEMWHQNEKMALYYDYKIQQAKTPQERIPNIFNSGLQWLHSGDFDKSIARFRLVTNLIEEGKLNLNEETEKQFYELLAVAYLRKGEIENCVQQHNELSCIIPLDPSAQHSLRTGSENAMDIYNRILAKHPDDLQSKWLLNLAHMTLGSYPNGVPAQHLLPEKIFESEYSLPPFVDKAMQAGLAVNDISGGCIMEDFNNDGLLDIIATSYGLSDQMHYFTNEGNGKFTDRTAEAGLTGLLSGLNTMQADYNNDGHIDFLVLRGAWLGTSGNHPNSLIKNNGDGTFSDVTESAGLLSYKPTQTAAWADFNQDGWLDLFVGNESSPKMVYTSELYLNQQNGTFKEVSAEYGLIIGAYIKGCTWTDYNNDGYPDLFASNLIGDNLLFQNLGKEGNYHFKEQAAEAGVQRPRFSFPCWSWDYNNDGLLDLFVSAFNIQDFTSAAGKLASDYLGQSPETEYPCLYQNNGDGTFKEVTQQANLKKVLYTMGCNFGDIDNDGFLDFYATTGTPDFRSVFPNRMFRNDNGERFQDVTTTTKTGHIQKGHGVAFGDIDNDGDQDIYHVLGGSYSGDNFMNALFENPGNDQNWVQFQLEGTQSNRSAIGAKVKIEGLDASGKTRTLYRVVGSGASFGASSLRLEVGLGDVSQIASVEIDWPFEGSKTVLKDLEVNKVYKVLEGEEEVREVKLEDFKL